MDYNKFTIFVRFERRLIRLLVSRCCSLIRLEKYCTLKFGVADILIKDSVGNVFTAKSFGRLLSDWNSSSATLFLETRKLRKEEVYNHRFKGYLKLLNHKKIRSQPCSTLFRQKSFNKKLYDEKVSMKPKVVFRQKSFNYSTDKKVELRKSRKLFDENVSMKQRVPFRKNSFSYSTDNKVECMKSRKYFVEKVSKNQRAPFRQNSLSSSTSNKVESRKSRNLFDGNILIKQRVPFRQNSFRYSTDDVSRKCKGSTEARKGGKALSKIHI